jgi:hypothetical protein
MAKTPKPTPSPTPTADSSVTGLLGYVPSPGGGTKIGQFDISSNKYNVAGLNLPKEATGGQTELDADQFIKALQITADKAPNVWAGIQYAMYKANYYGNSMPTIGKWDSTSTNDLNATKSFMQSLTVHNSADPTVAAPVTTFLQDQENAAIKLGGNGVRSQIAKVSVPNQMDLSYLADKAFRDVLGEGATEKQRKQFSALFQSQVMTAARMSQAATQQQPPAVAPVAPTTPGTPGSTPAATPTLDQNLQSANFNPSTSLAAVQQAPDVNVAAAEFARQADPTQAGVNGLNGAIDTWFKSLGGRGTK